MAELAVKEPGLDAAFSLGPVAAAGAGDQFVNDGKTLLYVKNVNASTRTVTVAGQRPCSFGVAASQHNSATPVAQNEERLIGPFNPNRFNDANGKCQVTYSSEVGVTVSAVRMPS